jgi:hypothetical protein
MGSSRLLVLVFLFLLGLGLPSCPAVAGTVETRIKEAVIQNFLECVFPVALNREVDLLGLARIPVTVRLSRPRSLLTEREQRRKSPVCR